MVEGGGEKIGQDSGGVTGEEKLVRGGKRAGSERARKACEQYDGNMRTKWGEE